jgi:hypothetical protein
MSVATRVGMADECRLAVVHPARTAVFADRDMPSVMMTNDAQQDCSVGGMRDHFFLHVWRLGGSRALVTK